MSIVGFPRSNPSVRYVSLILFAGALAKILFLDMAGTLSALRIFLLLTLGVLLLTVRYLYDMSIRKPASA